MGFFNKLFGNKQEQTSKTALEPENTEQIRYYYLYGFVNTNPNYSFTNEDLAKRIYQKIIGSNGGVMINGSFHPYCVVNAKGVNIWDAAHILSKHNNENLINDLREGNLFFFDLASQFNQLLLWRDDTRLTFEENPLFGKVVPFLIPFLVLDKGRDTYFDQRIVTELNEQGHAHNYLEEINTLLKEFMHESVFVLGFDEVNPVNKHAIIDNFVNAKKLFEQ